MDCSPPGSSVHGILQARVLQWAASSSSRGSSRPRDWTHVSRVSSFTTEPSGKPPKMHPGFLRQCPRGGRIHPGWIPVFGPFCKPYGQWFLNSKWKKVKVNSFSRVRLFVTPGTVAYHAPPSIHGISQASILEWVAISFSRGSSPPRDWTRVSRIVGRRFTIWAARWRVRGGSNCLNHRYGCWDSQSPGN